MARDAVANVVDQLRERGYAPRKVGHDAWESRCPAHRSSDYALSITRNEFNHVVLECRSTVNCQHTRIIRALGFTNEHVYAETPDWLIRRLNGAGIQSAEFKVPEAHENHEHCPASADLVSGSGEVSPLDAGKAEASETPSEGASAIGSHGGSPSRDVSEALSEGASALGSHGGSPSRDVRELAAPSMTSAIDDSSRRSTREETGGKPVESASPSQVLASLTSGAKLFRSADGRFFAQVPVGERFEVYGLKSAAFRDWLIDGYLVSQPEPPSPRAILRAVGMLEARARFKADIPEVFIPAVLSLAGCRTPFASLSTEEPSPAGLSLPTTIGATSTPSARCS
jgi:hypothetical protein